MEEKNNNQSNRKERNIQKNDFNKIHKSNSQFFYKQISNNDYDNRISLNPSGENGSHDIRYHYPSGHVNSYIEKCDYNTIAYNSFNKAEKELNIDQHIKNQKYQNLLENIIQIFLYQLHIKVLSLLCFYNQLVYLNQYCNIWLVYLFGL